MRDPMGPRQFLADMEELQQVHAQRDEAFLQRFQALVERGERNTRRNRNWSLLCTGIMVLAVIAYAVVTLRH